VTERDPRLDRRREITGRLVETRARWIVWRGTPRSQRPTCFLDDYFNALADAGDFNRQHPDLKIRG